MSRIILPSGLQVPDNAGECVHPRLYPDLGWWCPSLQPLGGLLLQDLSRSRNFATLTNMDPPTDWVVSNGQGALDFDGTNDYALTTGRACNGSVGDFSVSAWVKTTSTTRGTICGVVEDGLAGILHLAINTTTVTDNVSGTIYFQCRQGSHFQVNASGAGVNDGRWRNIVAVRSAGTPYIYLDGKPLTLTYTVNNLTNDTLNFVRPMAIGCRNLRGTFDVPLSGQLDDLRFFSRAASISDAMTLYQLGRGNLPVKRRRKYVVVDGAADQTITANLFTNTSTVYNPTVTADAVNISANLLTNTSTVYEPTVSTGASNIDANLLTNTSTVYNPTVAAGAVNISANLFTNTNTFYDAVVSISDTIVTDLLTNTSTVYNPTVTAGAVNITAQLLTNTSTVYLPTVALLVDNISAFRIDNTSVIYLPTLTGGDVGVKDTSDILNRGLKRKKKRKTQEEIDEENIAAQILKARQGKKPKYQEPKQELQLNLKAKLEAEQSVAEITEEVAEVMPEVPFTDEMRQEIASILETYKLKLKQQRRAKQLQVLMLLATMDD
jgi:hypothetical protein